MPTNVIKSWAHGSKEKEHSLENKWEKAKKVASKEGGKRNAWAYKMAIFKKMAHHESVRDYVLGHFLEVPDATPPE